ncbi:type II secretion system protein GspL [Alisedimentitalea sp. MJ-SS2]|uniref:type II secretion system protein GspL n=1 Tax=Aliisedimentitalea sp. MJ-SS2 TaxID=3049795 RepID=UPI00290D4DD6|nr:type II secretion system protein GspL [Alisedimentitalea sp. MJ-SS2]MDU8925816.1 type II secretion system protein GspL [Alisedimentitalea sp. MJ-SS2]
MTAASPTFNPKGFLRLDGVGSTRPGKRQVALVPGARVAVMTLDLPAGLQGAAREKVARRQVSDMTGQTAEALDIRPFHGPGGARAWTRVLVAGADEVAGWRRVAGERCRAVLPDYLGLPAAEGLWTVYVEADTVMARLGPGDGFSAAPELAGAMLQRAWDEVEERDRPKAILLIGQDAAGLRDWADATGVAVVEKIAELGRLGVATPKPLAHGELGFDLRRDAQAARARLRARVLPWRWPVLIGLVAAGLWAAGQILATQRLEEQRREMTAATIAQVREHFVPQGPILDIRTQVSREIEARQAGRGGGPEVSHIAPLELFGATAEVLAAQRARVGVVSYGPVQGLEITAELADFAALDGLVEALGVAGLQVTVLQSRSVDGGTEARLKLSTGIGGEDRP